MSKEFGRNLRVARFIKEEVSVLIQREFPLDEYVMITLTRVEVSPDLKNATLYFTALNNNNRNEQLVLALNAKSGYFRRELARVTTHKLTPALHFKYDESFARAQRLTDIIESVSKREKERD